MCAIFCVQYSVCNILHTIFSVRYLVCKIWCTISCNIRCEISNVQYLLYNIQCTISSVQYWFCNILAVRGVVQNPVSCSSSHTCALCNTLLTFDIVIIIIVTIIIITMVINMMTLCNINNPSPSVFHLLQLDSDPGPEIS